jgi:hypothetical protein
MMEVDLSGQMLELLYFASSSHYKDWKFCLTVY